MFQLAQHRMSWWGFCKQLEEAGWWDLRDRVMGEEGTRGGRSQWANEKHFSACYSCVLF